jgi:hypothetical protein
MSKVLRACCPNRKFSEENSTQAGSGCVKAVFPS